MSSVVEIQAAIKKLPARQKQALSAWLSSQDEDNLSAREEAALLASLDEAARQLDAGEGVPLETVKGPKARNVIAWAEARPRA